MPPLEDRVEYPYMNIRTKAYPWGDGDKVSHIDPSDQRRRSNVYIEICRLYCKVPSLRIDLFAIALR